MARWLSSESPLIRTRWAAAVHPRDPCDGERSRRAARGRSSDDEVLEDYPYLEREDVYAALEYAAAAVSERELPTPAA